MGAVAPKTNYRKKFCSKFFFAGVLDKRSRF